MMMKIEIRDDVVKIDGYVNAVERFSKPLKDDIGTYNEKISAGAFTRALQRAKNCKRNIPVLLNHDENRVLTSTKDSTTRLVEDNIGLRCTCEVREKEIIDKAKKGMLVGWSFGFVALKQNRTCDAEPQQRSISDLELTEVSILDNTKIPAYDGTSIETRSSSDNFLEIRMQNDAVEIDDLSTPPKEPAINQSYELRYRLLALDGATN